MQNFKNFYARVLHLLAAAVTDLAPCHVLISNRPARWNRAPP
jgi:hypothetical protein